MARRRRPLALLIAALGVGLAGAAFAAGTAKLQALVWIAPGHELAAMSRQPATCLPADDAQVEAGRALFNAPQLLGGQASRAGVSCASCHSNGRRNPHFELAGVSQGPGTADVSASFFSPARSNGRFDPVAIPDLAGPGKISRDPRDGQLERFMQGLIVEEFSGPEPSTEALSALASYVRAVRTCEGREDEPRGATEQLDLIRASVTAARRFARDGDKPTAALLVAAARRQLGLIDERLAPFGHEAARKQLLAMSRNLQRTAADPTALDRWLAMFERGTAPVVERAAAASLYDPARIVRWLARAQPAASGRQRSTKPLLPVNG